MVNWPATLLLIMLPLLPAAAAQAADKGQFRQAPRAINALQQGQAAQNRGNISQAIRHYCVAASTGNPEGYYRIGRLLAPRNPKLANGYLAMAMRLGSQQAARYYNSRVGNTPIGDNCGAQLGGGGGFTIPSTPFNLDAYLARQSPAKRRLATLLRQAADRHEIDPRLVLAIAIAESNLETHAVSPKNAQGVMQLIPATQARFGVTRPFDPEQNIRGALAYLKWLDREFDGDWVLMSAAYNAGEESVTRYGGIPPYAETQHYVRKVLYFAGQDPLAKQAGRPNR
ncbi:lytic transglycosylase domain-containing protein [Aeromonas bivalvium]|uniref:lytic transglycosylase domain-containing protein n=1 Tax=Aeromonas bivalvium TaxID=440079 RepID=UPI000A03DC74|nr:lytic transglycosylase domain-containing protein [Aeromonas bivalvium]